MIKSFMLFFATTIIIAISSFTGFNHAKYKEGKYYSEPPEIQTICSSCKKGKTNCVYPKWYMIFREGGDFVEVCDKTNYCKWKDVKKGGEWFYKFYWSEKVVECE